MFEIKAMMRYLPVALVAALLALDGAVYGIWTDRWAKSEELRSAAARLDEVPLVIGDWQGKPAEPLSDREVAQAGFEGYLLRRYENRKSGAAVSVLLACGRAGPLSVHTPDVCYRGAGYQVEGAQARYPEGSAPSLGGAEFWRAQFGKLDSAEPVQLRIHWAWKAGGTWTAPTNPRFALAGAPVLHKLYVVHEMMRNDSHADSVCHSFLSQFVPELERALAPKS